jgi:general L-amino acid transport system permease protein
MSVQKTIPARPIPPKRRGVTSLRSAKGRGIIYQIVAVASLFILVWLLANNTFQNMEARGIQGGFDFMNEPFGFDISESIISYDFTSNYWRAFIIGMLNTLKVALVGVILATIIGTLIGIGRFSRNWLVRKICYAYVEFFRNVPVYLQLLIWYLICLQVLPTFDNAWELGHFYLSKNGLSFPWPVWQLGNIAVLIGVLLGLCIAIYYHKQARHHFARTGQQRPVLWVYLLSVFGLGSLGWLLNSTPLVWNLPEKGLFMVDGGGTLSPEFIALLLGLTLYTASFIAEIVRSGIASITLGQYEAAGALGLGHRQTMRFIILPQALRVIVPPLTSQYLNLTKNSSLAVAIGYPDLVSIANTTLNQTGRAIEALAIVMLVYLTISLTTSAFMNWFNARVAIQER